MNQYLIKLIMLQQCYQIQQFYSQLLISISRELSKILFNWHYTANETCIDSVELNFSDWQFLTIDKVTGKSPTDTVEL